MIGGYVLSDLDVFLLISFATSILYLIISFILYVITLHRIKIKKTKDREQDYILYQIRQELAKSCFENNQEKEGENKMDAYEIIKEWESYNAKIIKIKYHSDEIEKLRYIDAEKSNWIDLRAAEDVTLKAGEFKLISLGVSMELPEGYEAHIVPRSSTYKNFGIIQTNHCAVIDNSYCGDNDIWKYPAYALRDTEIHVNDRICQFRIIKNQPKLYFDEVETLGNADRGGIGSTGKQ